MKGFTDRVRVSFLEYLQTLKKLYFTATVKINHHTSFRVSVDIKFC